MRKKINIEHRWSMIVSISEKVISNHTIHYLPKLTCACIIFIYMNTDGLNGIFSSHLAMIPSRAIDHLTQTLPQP